ncbi:hypothetical protein KCU99_g438, partial [Aureobasidium melanogenum]
MTSGNEKQVGDGSMEDSSHETISGTVDVANKAENDSTEMESSATTIKAETNNSSNAENASVDELAKLRDENTFLKNDRHHLIMRANAEIHRLSIILTERDASIAVAKKSIAGKQKQLDSLYATLQRQEKQITAQAAQITTLQEKQAAKLKKIRLRMNLMVRRNAKRFERQLAENVYEVREWADAVKLLIKQETDSERGTDEEEEVESEDEDEDEDGGQAKGAKDGEMVVIEINDDETAGAEQPTVNEQSAVHQQSDTSEQPIIAPQSTVIEQCASNEQSASKEQSTLNGQPASNEQSAISEQSAVIQQSDTSEQPTIAQQSTVVEQPLTTEQPAASEEHPSKRVKLTEEA